MPIPQEYVNQAQLMVVAPSQAEAQAALEAAVAACKPVLDGLAVQVALQPEVEDGQYVLSLP